MTEKMEGFNMKRIIKIDGMSCMHCVAHVKEALEVLEGIETVEVLLDQHCAIITGEASEEAIKAAIDDAGYDVIAIEQMV